MKVTKSDMPPSGMDEEWVNGCDLTHWKKIESTHKCNECGLPFKCWEGKKEGQPNLYMWERPCFHFDDPPEKEDSLNLFFKRDDNEEEVSKKVNEAINAKTLNSL